MKTTILLLALFVFAAAVSKNHVGPHRQVLRKPDKEIFADLSSRIIGGREPIPHTLPYQAYLYMHNYAELWSCSGSIISKHYILTSGRCLEGAIQVHVIMGAHNVSEIEPTQVSMPTIGIRIHPDYSYVSGKAKNDVALLKMEFDIPFNQYIQPIALPTKDDILDSETFVGHVARSGGWGLTDGIKDEYPDVLTYFDAKVIKNSECDDTFFNLTSSVLCTAPADSGICQGDVGGPLVADFKQIGISSWWAINCITGYPSGYTRVSSYIDWIVATSDVVLV